jgi:hypothetical protein
MTEASRITNYLKNDLFKPHFQQHKKKAAPFSGSPFNRQITGSDRTKIKMAPYILDHIKNKSFDKDSAGFSKLKSYPMQGDLYRAGLRNKIKSVPVNMNRINADQISAQQELQETITSVDSRDALLYIPTILAKLQIAQQKGVDPVYNEAELLYLKKLNIISDVELIAYIDALPQNIKQNLIALIPAGGIIPPVLPAGGIIPPVLPAGGIIPPVLPAGGIIPPVLPAGGIPVAPPLILTPKKTIKQQLNTPSDSPPPYVKNGVDLDEVESKVDIKEYELYSVDEWKPIISNSPYMGLQHINKFGVLKSFRDAIVSLIKENPPKIGLPPKFTYSQGVIIKNTAVNKGTKMTLSTAFKLITDNVQTYKLNIKNYKLFV